jgi:hypothetical protein
MASLLVSFIALAKEKEEISIKKKFEKNDVVFMNVIKIKKRSLFPWIIPGMIFKQNPVKF